MANKTKAELVNEIKALQACIKANEQWRRENNSEIKELRDENKSLSLIVDRKRNDYNDLNEMRNGAVQRSAEKTKQIKQLQADKAILEELEDDYRKEIKELKAVAIEMRNEVNNLEADRAVGEAFEGDYRNEIKVLRKAVAELGHVISEKDSKIKRLRGLELSAFNAKFEKDKEIKDLRDSVRQRDALITVNAKEIKQLQAEREWADQVINENAKEIKVFDGLVQANDSLIARQVNEIKELRADYDNRQAVINEKAKEVKDLQAKVTKLQKLSDTEKFHNATEAMGNPLYFQEVG